MNDARYGFGTGLRFWLDKLIARLLDNVACEQLDDRRNILQVASRGGRTALLSTSYLCIRSDGADLVLAGPMQDIIELVD